MFLKELHEKENHKKGLHVYQFPRLNLGYMSFDFQVERGLPIY